MGSLVGIYDSLPSYSIQRVFDDELNAVSKAPHRNAPAFGCGLRDIRAVVGDNRADADLVRCTSVGCGIDAADDVRCRQRPVVERGVRDACYDYGSSTRGV
jgi:hypothetical protein